LQTAEGVDELGQGVGFGEKDRWAAEEIIEFDRFCAEARDKQHRQRRMGFSNQASEAKTVEFRHLDIRQQEIAASVFHKPTMGFQSVGTSEDFEAVVLEVACCQRANGLVVFRK
jgi:hypothetical protein